MTGDLEVRRFGEDTESDAILLCNSYISGWPYCRPVDRELTSGWRTLDAFQPEHMLLAYRHGKPRAFLHGERDGKQHNVHLLAVAPGCVEEGVWLLNKVEERARAELAERLCSPFHRAALFYGGYILGREPYHPHWAVDGTAVYVRAGYRISLPAVILVHDFSTKRNVEGPPLGYEIAEAASSMGYEYGARTFRLVAMNNGVEVAACVAMLFDHALEPAGGPVGQLGPVSTLKDHRNKGLARVLCQSALERLLEMGAVQALVSTGLDNYPALRVYERIGFRRRYNINEWSKNLA